MTSESHSRIREIGDESRRRILDAAESLFAERGIERTSFVDISERAGISRGSIPWHFKNKDGLVMAVFGRSMDRFMGPGQYEAPPTLARLFCDYIAWINASNGTSAMIFMVLTEAMNSSGAVHEQYLEFLQQQRKGLERWLRAQRPEGVDPEAAAARERPAAAALSGVATGLHLQALIDPEGIDLGAALQSVAAIFDDHLGDVWAGLSVEGDVER